MEMSIREASQATFRLIVAACLVTVALTTWAQDGGSAQPSGSEMPLDPEARSETLAALAPRYLDWLRSVRGLITQPEVDYFLRLTEDFRRDLFMRAFWDPRDPDPQTPGNELKARWEEYKDQAGGVPYDDPRFLLLLFNGPPGGWSLPDGRPVALCFSRSRELEIWFYGASDRSPRQFPVILLRRGSQVPYEVHLPGANLRAMQRSGGLPSVNIQQLCADELLRYTLREISRITDYDQLLRDVLTPHLPSPEWLADLASSATDLPQGVETFDVVSEVTFPARRQSRIAVRVMLGVPLAEAPGRLFDGELFHNFRLTGEVVRDGKLFESFRYGFEGPTPAGAVTIPVGFTRHLRPGRLSLRLLLEDAYSGRFARVVHEIEVPSTEGLPAEIRPQAAEVTGGPTLKLASPPGQVHTGKVRFRARAQGDIEKVTFFLDESPVLSKRRPPYSVELELGQTAEPRRVRVVGFAGDTEVATDQIWLNQGAQRLRVHLIEPRPGGIYPGGLTARVQVDTPNGEPPERLELYLDEEQVRVFAKPPYEHRLPLPGVEAAVVRAVAHLEDGSSAEDVAVVGSAAFLETVEVRLVEIHAVVNDALGQPMRGLSSEQFRVFDEGAARSVERFQELADAPLSAALLIDRSASMESHLRAVTGAANSFAKAALKTGEDRISVLSFADDLVTNAGFTSGIGDLERALAGLDARGRTAFYDGLVQALNTFDGIAGPRALVVYTDGQDETSRLSFEQVLETARRTSVALYVVGLEQAFLDRQTQQSVEKLAEVTGGRAFFLKDLENLEEVYLAILEELRSRYLLVFQPPVAAGNAGWRTLRVEVEARGARVRARQGYYP